jgi:hypothetical protein
VDQGLSEAHAPPKSLGQSVDHLVDDGRERQPIDHHGAPLAPPLALETAYVGDEVQEFRHREMKPAIMRMVVDLPAPFAPKKPSTSPGATEKVKSSTARMSP